MVTIIAVGNYGRCHVYSLTEDNGNLSGREVVYEDGQKPVMRNTLHSFSSQQDAESIISLWHNFTTVVTEEELLKAYNSLFPSDIDVVEHGWHPICLSYRLKGYDVVWSGDNPRVGMRRVSIRIPESGQVRCPATLMGRVIGKKGVKINELSKKHGVKIRLVEIPD